MDRISRKAAKERGLIHYFTGQPCKHGHTSYRFARNGECKQCSLERVAEYYHANKEARQQYTKKWREENKERISATNRIWKRRNRGVCTYHEGKRRAAMKYDCSEIRMIYEDAQAIGYHVDHVIPLSKGGAHTIDNLQIVSPKYNLRKRNRVFQERRYV